ncbi:right-handed parallel beta-helix repeat-containing protein [Paenibacillus sp. RUD330]|uniref:right-handed parallel beta-helix repeat-containing protein n=1 Tax=Paenibacillus sp. RUD330 TaxID=2023772 RepID=UPI000B92DA96|nr:right-handed parallel beta-helix repeat-containing protein [Paenibacillus sp. RUD330]ASS64687.1 hypothetical protein CIC07_00130 [Paenibacillus sp. RUD330]
MASLKTPRMGMDDWIGTDSPKRAEISGNFNKVDTEFADREMNIKWFKTYAGVDYTKAINDAITFLYDNYGGGAVFIPPDVQFQATQVRLKTKITLRGVGKRSRIIQAPNSNVDFIVFDNTSVEHTTLRDLFIHGNKDNQNGAGGNAIFYDNTDGKFSFYDTLHTIENVIIYIPKKSGIATTANVRELNAKRVFVTGADMYGFDLAGTDSIYEGCTTGAAGMSGFRIASPNSRFSACKAYGSGRLALAGNTYGFMIRQPRISLTACEAQDNAGHGFLILGTKEVTLSGCIADSNGRNGGGNGVRLDSSSNCNIDVTTMNRETGVFPQRYGVEFAGTSGNNTVKLISSNNANGHIVESSTSNGNSITVNGQNGVQTIDYSSIVTPDPYNGGTITISLTNNLTMVEPIRAHKGMKMKFILKQDSVGGRNVYFQSFYKRNWTPDTGPNKINTIEFQFDGTYWVQSGVTIGLT